MNKGMGFFMKNFEELYNELKINENSDLEKLLENAKREEKKSKKMATIICLIIDILFFVILFNFNIKEIKAFNFFNLFSIIFPLFFLLIINLIIFLVCSVFNSKEYTKYKNEYKNKIIKKLMQNFYDNLEYYPEKAMPEYIYRKINYENYDIYSSDDYMEALVNNKYSIQMAEIETEEEEKYKDSNGEEQIRRNTLFHGLFAKIEVDKSINSELKIQQNGIGILNKNRLKMDSSEFEKYFDVVATNKIIGMQLLTADIMEDLIEFQNKTNMRYDVIIKNNEIYLRFYSGPMFEVESIKKEALNEEAVKKYFYMLNFTYNLSNKLINIINDTEI